MTNATHQIVADFAGKLRTTGYGRSIVLTADGQLLTVVCGEEIFKVNAFTGDPFYGLITQSVGPLGSHLHLMSARTG